MLHATSNRKSPQGIGIERSKYAMRKWDSPTERAWEHNVWLVLYIVNDGVVAFKLIIIIIIIIIIILSRGR